MPVRHFASLGLLAGLLIGLSNPMPLAAISPERALGEALLEHNRCRWRRHFQLSPDGRFMIENTTEGGTVASRAHDFDDQTVRDLRGRLGSNVRWVGAHSLLHKEAGAGQQALLDLLSGQARSLGRVVGLEDEILSRPWPSLQFGRRIVFSAHAKGSGAKRLVSVDIDTLSVVNDWGPWTVSSADLHQNRKGIPLAHRTIEWTRENRLPRETLQGWRGSEWAELLTFQSGRNGHRIYAGADVDPLADGAAIHMVTNRGRDRFELARFELASGRTSSVLRPEHGDLDQVFFTDDRATPLFGLSHDSLPVYHPLSEFGQRLIELAATGEPSHLQVISASGKPSRAVVRRTTLSRGIEFLLVDLASETTRILQHCPFAAVSNPVVARSVHIDTAQGHRLKGVLVEPATAAGPLPLLLRPAPNTREVDAFWGYAEEAAFFASRGYRVLTANYRGALGNGSSFRDLGYLNFEAAYDDIRQAVEWSIDQGHAAPGRVFLTGDTVGAQLAVAVLASTLR